MAYLSETTSKSVRDFHSPLIKADAGSHLSAKQTQHHAEHVPDSDVQLTQPIYLNQSCSNIPTSFYNTTLLYFSGGSEGVHLVWEGGKATKGAAFKFAFVSHY